jgi:hypothetical protein
VKSIIRKNNTESREDYFSVFYLHIQAVVLAHNISHILTLNPKDFIEVEGIAIVHPNSINS